MVDDLERFTCLGSLDGSLLGRSNVHIKYAYTTKCQRRSFCIVEAVCVMYTIRHDRLRKNEGRCKVEISSEARKRAHIQWTGTYQVLDVGSTKLMILLNTLGGVVVFWWRECHCTSIIDSVAK